MSHAARVPINKYNGYIYSISAGIWSPTLTPVKVNVYINNTHYIHEHIHKAYYSLTVFGNISDTNTTSLLSGWPSLLLQNVNFSVSQENTVWMTVCFFASSKRVWETLKGLKVFKKSELHSMKRGHYPGRVPTSFWWYLMASLSLARSWHCLGSSSSLWSLSLWFRMVSSSLELLAWSRRSLANRLHCCDSSSYSWRNSFSTWVEEDSSPQVMRVVRNPFEVFLMDL